MMPLLSLIYVEEGEDEREDVEAHDDDAGEEEESLIIFYMEYK